MTGDGAGGILGAIYDELQEVPRWAANWHLREQ